MRKRTLCNPNCPAEEIQSEQTYDTYDINEEPIVISKSTIDLFLRQDKPGDVMALYQFYYYTAKWQKTNQPRCTTKYAANGLKWSENKIRQTKKRLKELGLVEDIIAKDKAGKIKQHYIKVKFIWSRNEIQGTKNHPLEKPEYGEPLTMGNLEGNALSTNKENALSTNKGNALSTNTLECDISKKPSNNGPNPSIKERNRKYIPLAKHLTKIIQSAKDIFFTPKQITQWTGEIRQLGENNKVEYERIQRALNWYENHVGDQYVPVIESGASLRSKFIKLEAAIDRERGSSQRLGKLNRVRSDDQPYPTDHIIGR